MPSGSGDAVMFLGNYQSTPSVQPTGGIVLSSDATGRPVIYGVVPAAGGAIPGTADAFGLIVWNGVKYKIPLVLG
jgi:hypothetical protein